MMKEISKAVGSSKLYTNHSLRATAITLWSIDPCTDSFKNIMKISGYRNEESIKHYNTRPSAAQLRRCSDVLSEACTSTTNGTSDSNQATNQQEYSISLVPAVIQLELAVIPPVGSAPV